MTYPRVFQAIRSEGVGPDSRANFRSGTLAALAGALGGAAVLLAALLFATALGAPRTATMPDSAAAAAAGEVGSPQLGKIAYEFVGRIDQDGPNFVSYGYLTHVDGLPESVLFADPVNHSETTARITYYATGTLTARSVISGVTELNALGATRFYFDASGGANFANTATFADGTAIGVA